MTLTDDRQLPVNKKDWTRLEIAEANLRVRESHIRALLEAAVQASEVIRSNAKHDFALMDVAKLLSARVSHIGKWAPIPLPPTTETTSQEAIIERDMLERVWQHFHLLGAVKWAGACSIVFCFARDIGRSIEGCGGRTKERMEDGTDRDNSTSVHDPDWSSGSADDLLRP